MLSWGCGRPDRQAQAPASVETLVLAGVQVTAPAEGGWTVVEQGTDQIILSRRVPEATATLTARVLPGDTSSDEGAFVRSAEARQEVAVRALQMVSVHYNRSMLQGQTCLAYDGVWRDSLAVDPARRFRTLKGYVCRLPAASGRAVQMELAVHSPSRAPADLEGFLGVADAFFRSAIFVR
jgi:hypothetical protein